MIEKDNNNTLKAYTGPLSRTLREEYTIGEEYYRGDVKRGLRNSDGTGVLVGVSKVGSVQGYLIQDGQRRFAVHGAGKGIQITIKQPFRGPHVPHPQLRRPAEERQPVRTARFESGGNDDSRPLPEIARRTAVPESAQSGKHFCRSYCGVQSLPDCTPTRSAVPLRL